MRSTGDPGADGGGAPGRARLAIALLHHPVYERSGGVVTSSVTSVDLHDIARTARTYAVEAFYLVTPVEAQREMVLRIVSHWVQGEDGEGRAATPEASCFQHPRGEALARVRVADTLDAVVAERKRETGVRPTVVVTGASLDRDLTSFGDLRRAVARAEFPVLLVFGTGWGLARELTDAADVRLEPIAGLDGFNHLPVRAAVAIVLDRLLGPRL